MTTNESRAQSVDGVATKVATDPHARAGVTTGEWGETLRGVFGEYRAPTGVRLVMRGEHPENQRQFGEAMTEHHFERKVSNGTWYIGLGLPSDRPDNG